MQFGFFFINFLVQLKFVAPNGHNIPRGATDRVRDGSTLHINLLRGSTKERVVILVRYSTVKRKMFVGIAQAVNH